MTQSTAIRHIRYNRIPKDGQPGTDAYILVANPPILVMPCSSDGTNTLTGISTNLSVRKGGMTDTGWTFSQATRQGCSSTLVNSQLTVSNVTSDNARVLVVAYKDGINLQLWIEISRQLQGNTGKRGGFLLPPKEWSYENYPLGYQFKGYLDIDAAQVDCVLIKNSDNSFNAYVCKTGYIREENSNPPNNDSVHWEPAYDQGVEFLATRLFLAQKAYIDLLSANGIRIYDNTSKIVGQISSIEGAPFVQNIPIPLFIGGEMNENSIFERDPLFAIDNMGAGYFGGLSGLHIKIDPVFKAIQFYDSSGALVMVYTANTLAVNDVGNNSQDLDGSGLLEALTNEGSQIIQRYSRDIIPQDLSNLRSETKGILEITFPELRFEFTPNIQSFRPNLEVSMDLSVILKLKDGSITKSYPQTFTYKQNSDGNNPKEVVFPSRTVSFPIPYPMNYAIGYEINIYSDNSGSSHIGDFVLEPLQANKEIKYHFLGKGYSAEIGANGFQFSTDSDNFIYAIFDKATDKLKFKVRANGRDIIDSEKSS